MYWDPVTQSGWTSYQVGSQWHETFFENPTSLYDASQLAKFCNFAGVGIWALGMDNNDVNDLAALDGFPPAANTAPTGPTLAFPPAPPGGTSSASTTTTSAPGSSDDDHDRASGHDHHDDSPRLDDHDDAPQDSREGATRTSGLLEPDADHARQGDGCRRPRNPRRNSGGTADGFRQR